MQATFDVAVVGGGHAGCEAAAAAARLGAKVCLVTMSFSNIGQMSCNPSIGGVAKGIIVKEIDALDGLMARAIDMACIHYKTLNDSKGPAVWGPRAQADRELYADAMQSLIESFADIKIIEGEVIDIDVDNGEARGLRLISGQYIAAKSIVVTTGTFLSGKIFVGSKASDGGRYGEISSTKLPEKLRGYGIETFRLKTGTPARIERDSINFNEVEVQSGDVIPQPFSYLNDKIDVKQIDCYITRTNTSTHGIIKDNIDQSSMYSGMISGIGPRYCPSIEDKIVRFSGKESHQIFLEPEGLKSNIIYPNGISTSLPADIQDRFIRTIPGFGHAKVIRYGYAIEYDCVYSTSLFQTLESKNIKSLFFAGQINGTTGYEEAAGQGLVAGANAVLKHCGKEFVLSRAEAYIGVMIDDLVSLGVNEPYRMMTSRAEFRISLRPDNADERLHSLGIAVGLISEKRNKVFQEIQNNFSRLESICADERFDSDLKNRTILELIPDPKFSITLLYKHFSNSLYSKIVLQKLYAKYLYRVYEERQRVDIAALQEDSNLKIPSDISYKEVPSLSSEAVERLQYSKPKNMNELKKIKGLTPASILIVKRYVKKRYLRKDL
ncbi:tRNA uridine 5-carboxymethylaminomethyl modification enzyme MnmG [Candidatus Cyrtobacter comes]|uniref:tRNA uridine 5-carboxymethylaminomethyl modification enzyme MnmG n=1 Tax=Candidatus Cyrtobacter comes TaxID=675776 RepID=A0ABU5L873_9RICK|nr:tRNA uridine-5-carboxymethylaminomethyl(34) synthesis enzyme MnmG [Candidatus Cyrtobacter comes]MDZ5762321.1 tRNA uridine 5-carboxymethylaminomethyl modification enzyme MnmG [Candidatus Cyrtobacter comes]